MAGPLQKRAAWLFCNDQTDRQAHKEHDPSLEERQSARYLYRPEQGFRDLERLEAPKPDGADSEPETVP